MTHSPVTRGGCQGLLQPGSGNDQAWSLPVPEANRVSRTFRVIKLPLLEPRPVKNSVLTWVLSGNSPTPPHPAPRLPVELADGQWVGKAAAARAQF
jgi:hypothetical protein